MRKEPSGNEKSIRDYFLVTKQNCGLTTDVKLSRQTQIESDHFLVKIELEDN